MSFARFGQHGKDQPTPLIRHHEKAPSGHERLVFRWTVLKGRRRMSACEPRARVCLERGRSAPWDRLSFIAIDITTEMGRSVTGTGRCILER
jgi:hypothetical protein